MLGSDPPWVAELLHETCGAELPSVGDHADLPFQLVRRTTSLVV